MIKKEIQNSALANTLAITVLSSAIMLGAVGAYRLTSEHGNGTPSSVKADSDISESSEDSDPRAVSSDSGL